MTTPKVCGVLTRRSRPIIAIAATTAFLISSFVGLPAGPAQAAVAPQCNDLSVSVLQRTTSNGAGSFQSTSQSVVDAVKDSFPINKGAQFGVSTTAKEGLVPVYQLHKNGDFLLTTSLSEVESAATYGYQNQGITFYASGWKSDACMIPVYGYVLGTRHAVAVSDADRSALKAQGAVEEGIRLWVSPVAAAAIDTKFSFAVYPDTQNEVYVDSDTRFAGRSQWLVDNRGNFDLRFALHTGDIVSWDTPTHDQWVRASNAMKPLDNARIPYTMSVGNHDTGAVCPGGSACPGASAQVNVRNTTAMNSYFTASRFTQVKGAFEAGKVDNIYAMYEAGGQRWMVLSLELWPRQAVIDWAKQVVAANPTANVIVSTHAYMEGNNTISTSNGGYGATSPKHLYDTLISQYPNIKMVFSGHTGTAGSRVDTGKSGNLIFSYLNTFHSNTTNPVRIVEVDTATGTVSTRIETPHKAENFSQYTVTRSGADFILND